MDAPELTTTDERTFRAGDRVLANPPVHLVRGLGPIPDEPNRARAWWHSAKAVETYRLEASYGGDDLLGPAPDNPRRAEQRSIIQTTVRLDRLAFREPPARSLGRSLA